MIRSRDDINAEAYPVGTLVALKGHPGVPFKVIGYWRGYLRVEEPRWNTNHCADLTEIIEVVS